jgi:hypothetical protein
MKYVLSAKWILFLVPIVSLLTACGMTGGHFGIHWGDETAGGYPQVTEKVEKGGPPPHAPAHGYRAKHRYRYYPACSVYFEAERNLYFYLNGENWEVSASLPSDLQVKLGQYVSIDLDTDRPYLYYDEHKTKYSQGQDHKKGHKKK